MAAAALGRYFPNIEIASAGIAAVEGQRIPQSILTLADSWGLDVIDVVSHSLEGAQAQLISSDFVIVAEDEFIPHILEVGVAAQRILSMQDQRFDHSLIPFDPIGQGHQVTSVELAKAVMTSARLLRTQDNFGSSHRIEAIFTRDEGDFQSKLSSVWSQVVSSPGILVVTDFRAPNLQAVSQICDRVVELRVDRFTQGISFVDNSGDGALERALASQRPFAISARFEMDQVEKFCLSAQFTGSISNLAASRPVTILTEPQGFGPCSFLSAANATI